MAKFAKAVSLLAGLYMLGMSTAYVRGLNFLEMNTANACSLAFYTYTADTPEAGKVRLTGRTADLTDLLKSDNLIRIFPRGLEHNGNTEDESLPNPATWTSKYGSLVMDNFVEGINETGLCVHPLYLDKSVYPPQDGLTPCVSTFKVTTYLLDNAANVSECLDLMEKIIIVPEEFESFPLPMHWAIRDSANDFAIIEFVNGGSKRRPKSKTVIYRGSEYDILTNEPYLDKQLGYYRAFAKKRRALPGDFNAMARFVRLKVFKSTLAAGGDEWESVVNMFSLMSTVHCMPGVMDYARKEPNEPQWPTIYTTVTDLENWKYYVKLTKYPNTIWIDMKKIDFSTLARTGTLNPKSFTLSGEVNDNIVWE